MESPDTSPKDARFLSYSELAPLVDDTLTGKLREGHHDALAVLFDRYHRLASAPANPAAPAKQKI